VCIAWSSEFKSVYHSGCCDEHYAVLRFDPGISRAAHSRAHWHCETETAVLCWLRRVSSESSRRPAVSTGSLCSESSPRSVVSEEPYRPRFTMEQQRGLSGLFLMIHISARCNIYVSCLCYDVSVRLSVTEVYWRIIANLGFKFRSKFTAHCCRGEG